MECIAADITPAIDGRDAYRRVTKAARQKEDYTTQTSSSILLLHRDPESPERQLGCSETGHGYASW
jgi:hypothetical protein